MIRVGLPWLVCIYLMVFLAAIFLVWIAYEMIRRLRENHAVRYRLQCGICGMEYEDRTSAVLPLCPRCGSRNERSKLKAY